MLFFIIILQFMLVILSKDQTIYTLCQGACNRL